MEMKCYNFKDRRILFKYVYILIMLNIVNLVLSVIQDSTMWRFSINMLIIYLIVTYVIYRKTNANIFVDEHRIKSKKMIPFKIIKDISPTTEILIKADNTYDTIHMIQ